MTRLATFCAAMLAAVHAVIAIPTDVAAFSSPSDTAAKRQPQLVSVDKRDTTTVGLSTMTLYSVSNNTTTLSAGPATSVASSAAMVTTSTGVTIASLSSNNATMTATVGPVATQTFTDGSPSNSWITLWPTNGTSLSVSMTPTATPGSSSVAATALNVLGSSKNSAPMETTVLERGAVGLALAFLFPVLAF